MGLVIMERDLDSDFEMAYYADLCSVHFCHVSTLNIYANWGAVTSTGLPRQFNQGVI